MSKMIVYILDKFVWMLLVAVLTTQALQIAGVVESPKASNLGDIVYSNNNQYEYKLSVANQNRLRRQAGDRSPLLDSLFNERYEGEYFLMPKVPKVIRAKM